MSEHYTPMISICEIVVTKYCKELQFHLRQSRRIVENDAMTKIIVFVSGVFYRGIEL